MTYKAKCIQCGKGFESKYKTVKHCSRKCSIKTSVANRIQNGRPKILPESKACEFCGSIFKPKASRSKYCSMSCAGKSNADPVKMAKIASSRDTSYMQTEAYSLATRKETTSEYKRYANKVHRLSQKTYTLYGQEINPENHRRGRCGVEGAWQLDHIISIKYGFENNISAEEISKKENLRMLPWKENLSKSSKCQ